MSSVARRYAKALFDLARDAGSPQPIAEELEKIAAIAKDPAMGAVLSSPLLSATRRGQVADMLTRELHLSALSERFLRLVADHKRMAALPSIADHYQRLLDAQLNRARITIRSATPLAAAQLAEIVARFEQLTGKEMLPQIEIDPTLLGGVVVELGGKVYDGSVRNQFDRLAAQLTAASH